MPKRKAQWQHEERSPNKGRTTARWRTAVLRKTKKNCHTIRLDDAIPLTLEDVALFLRSWRSLNWSRNFTV
jgi:hypothetical protein